VRVEIAPSLERKELLRLAAGQFLPFHTFRPLASGIPFSLYDRVGTRYSSRQGGTTMRATEYQQRKKRYPGQSAAGGGKYVMNALRSHSRPVGNKPLIARPDDNPETRGVTKDPQY
jgi:hypothetical protein